MEVKEQALNIYGEPLQPCRPRSDGTRDNQGSWDAESGACNGDRIHSVCVSRLPSDFCRYTGQGDDASAWCARRRGQPHCICQGAFAMYAALSRVNADKGRGKQQALPLKCGAIHQDVLEDLGRQAAHWRAGFGGNVLPALRALDGSCGGKTRKKKKALRKRICDMYAKDSDPKSLAEDAWYTNTCRRRVWPWAGGA